MSKEATVVCSEHTLSSLRQGILAELSCRSINSTVCPSEVARRLDPQEWRALMPLVREAARCLAQEGRVEILQRGMVLSPGDPWRGPIRIGKPRAGR